MKKPLCLCENEMKVYSFRGHHVDIVYWKCDNEDCDVDPRDFPVDYEELGSLN